MEPNGRGSDQDENTGSVDRETAASSAPSSEAMHASPPQDVAEDEGQLGPDELPDPVEVVMNHEAKTHR